MDKSSLISRNREIIHDYLDEHIVMMNIENGQYYRFNEVGTRVWELLENGGQSIEALADKIKTEFSAGKDQIISDIMAFASKSCEQGLIRVA